MIVVYRLNQEIQLVQFSKKKIFLQILKYINILIKY